MAYTDKTKQYVYDYKAKNIKRVPLDLQLTEYLEIKAAAEASGESVNGFIKTAIRQRMDREGFRQADQACDPATLGEMGAADVGGVNPPTTEK